MRMRTPLKVSLFSESQSGTARLVESASVDAKELALQQAIVITKLLLLDQAKRVIRMLAARFGAMDARTVIAAFEILGRAKDRNTEAAADANTRTSITSHNQESG